MGAVAAGAFVAQPLFGVIPTKKRQPENPNHLSGCLLFRATNAPVLGGFSGLPQAGVVAVLRDEAGVVALFYQLAVVEDENLRGVADGSEAIISTVLSCINAANARIKSASF